MRIFKKTIAVCLVGLGLGMLLVVLLPFRGWLFLVGLITVSLGICWLCS